jgi:hypothetical protein
MSEHGRTKRPSLVMSAAMAIIAGAMGAGGVFLPEERERQRASRSVLTIRRSWNTPHQGRREIERRQLGGFHRLRVPILKTYVEPTIAPLPKVSALDGIERPHVHHWRARYARNKPPKIRCETCGRRKHA